MNTNKHSMGRTRLFYRTLFCFMLVVLLGQSCIKYTTTLPQEQVKIISHPIGYVSLPDWHRDTFMILDVEYDNNKHEILYNGSTFDHWPSCKYCSEEPSEQNPVPERQELKPLKQMEKRDLQVIRKLTITPSGK